jgi:branched-subunit amino acid aminotransferase/4-amino-4-deoxychorismate lyase
MPAFFNDRFVNDEEVLLHVSDLSMQRGYAVFDFFRSVNGRPLFMNDHLQRFFNSAKAMHLSVPYDAIQLSDIVIELLKKTSYPETGIRIMLTGGYSPNSYQLAAPNLIITSIPLKTAGREDFEKGMRVISYEHQRELPHIKSINYQMAVWLQPLLNANKADDVIYYKNGIVTEFPRSNIFMVSAEGKILSPANNVLHGITRSKILELAKEIAETEEKDVSIGELMNAKEVFASSTTKRILPVVTINGVSIGSGQAGPVTRLLYEKFLALENEHIKTNEQGVVIR